MTGMLLNKGVGGAQGQTHGLEHDVEHDNVLINLTKRRKSELINRKSNVLVCNSCESGEDTKEDTVEKETETKTNKEKEKKEEEKREWAQHENQAKKEKQKTKEEREGRNRKGTAGERR